MVGAVLYRLAVQFQLYGGPFSHASFGIYRLNSLRAAAASVKHKYYAKNTIKCYLNLHERYAITKAPVITEGCYDKSLTYLYMAYGNQKRL